MVFQRATCLVLLFPLAFPPLAVSDSGKLYHRAQVTQGNDFAGFSKPLSNTAAATQALDRLTFGPQPGDAVRVEEVGLKKWIELQLEPGKIAKNPVVEEKLAAYGTLGMSSRQIFLHYPPTQLIAAIARGRQAPPTDPESREVVEHLVDRYLKKQAKQGSEGSAATDDSDLESRVPLASILTATEIDTLKFGKADEKRAVLSRIPAEKQLDFAYALRPQQRKALIPLSPVSLQRTLKMSVAPPQVVLMDLASAKILRAVYSNRQLEEQMVDFWFNHFNVYFDKGADRYLLTEYERDAIRPHVLGRFYDLLLATAKSPAMLFYLDNAESVSPTLQETRPRRLASQKRTQRGLNENYGRELMELHTLGVEGGYTQRDVTEVARCFTGWTIAPPKRGSGFEFNPRVHDFGRKVVLGRVIRAGGGMEDGLEVLKILASSPQTAHHLSLKLAQRFVADNPPPSLVDRMAATYMKRKGDIREVMRTMIFSPEFFSEGAYRVKVKTPFEMTVSAVRATNASVDSPLAIDQQIAQLGEPLYRKVEPTGYSTTNAEWISSASLLGRMNFSLALANNRLAGIRVDVGEWQRRATDDPLNVARMLLDQEPAAPTRNAIQKALGDVDVRNRLTESAKLLSPSVSELVAGLVLGSPEFQRR